MYSLPCPPLFDEQTGCKQLGVVQACRSSLQKVSETPLESQLSNLLLGIYAEIIVYLAF